MEKNKMFKNEADFKRLTDRLNIDDKPNSAHRENLRRQMLSAFDEAAQKSTTRIIDFRTFGRIIMKSKMIKLAAAATIIIVAGIFLYSTNNMVPAAYALQDTIEAYNSIRSLHIKVSQTVGQQAWTSQIWLECDRYGNINRIRLHTPYCGEPVGSLTIVGSGDYAEAWLARHNLHIVGYGNPSGVLGFDVSQIDPKGLIERLSQQQEFGEIILDVNEPVQKDKPILVTVTYPQGSLSENWKKVLYIDQATWLVKKIEKFELRDKKYQYVCTSEFFDYNQQIDPAIFSLEGEIPADATVFDVTDVEAGLLQGDMTDEEVATEIVRQFFEAAIAKDFTRAGQLYLGAPGFLVEQAFMGANLLEITSIGPAQPETDPDSKAFVCSCKLLLELDGQYYEINGSMRIKQISTEPEPRRWLMIGFLSMSINPPSGGITLSKTGVNPDAVTYYNLEPGQFMKKWLVLDPIWIEVRGDTLFPVEETQKDYFETDQINVAQFETVVTFDEKNYEWSLLESKYNTIDLTSVNENWYLVTYLYSQISMPEEKQGFLGIGSDDSVKVWLNGELVHENWVVRGTEIDNDRVPVRFKKGMNQIVIKVQNRGGPWGFCCQLLDE
jgi:hypothetical protein